MHKRALNTWQTAFLLMSASCGVGFVMGTGELALREGMASCLYAVSTAVGLALLGLAAPSLRERGHTIWAGITARYGRATSQHISCLSLIWMTGVLATQIRGSCAILNMVGIPENIATISIGILLISLSFLGLSWLSSGFAVLMLGCDVMLANSLFNAGHIGLWLQAPSMFAHAILTKPDPLHSLALSGSMVIMVLCGADYQQFVFTTRSSNQARTAGLLSSIAVFAIGFLPAAAVMSTVAQFGQLRTPSQVIPMILMQTLGGHIYAVCFILLAATLGSGYAVLRGMMGALESIATNAAWHPLWLRILPLLIASFIAVRSQGLIDTMVALNMVYIASLAPIFITIGLRIRVSARHIHAATSISSGLALTYYLGHWINFIPWSVPTAALPFTAACLFLGIIVKTSQILGKDFALSQDASES